MIPSYRLARVFFSIVAAYHVILGGVLIFSGEASIQTADLLYGWTIADSPTLGIAGEILGCYFIAFGLAMAAAARDPVRNSACITVGLVLVGLRLFQRAFFADKVMEIFQVSAGRYWSAFVFVLVLGALMLYFRIQVARDASSIQP